MDKEQKENLLQLWKSNDYSNGRLADSILESMREELPEYLVKELLCARMLLFEISVQGSNSIALLMHNCWLRKSCSGWWIGLRKSKLLRLGFQGTRLLQREKQNIMQFFCGRSKPTFELELRKPFYRMIFEDGGAQPSKQKKTSA